MNEWSRFGHHRQLNVNFLQAFHAVRGYPRHSHDYYVIAVVDSGAQSFVFNGSTYTTPVDGLILLNPGDVHTGEPVGEHGFGYRAIYPTVEHMQMLAVEAGWPDFRAPTFTTPRADDFGLMTQIRALFAALDADEPTPEAETRFLATLAGLMQRYGGQNTPENSGAEHRAVREVVDYIHANYAQPVSLAELARLVNFSRYYLLHTFRDRIGMPPHRYLESVRIHHAQRLLRAGEPLIDVAHLAGFASQSHFTQRFRQIIGVTPGEYARQVAR